MHIMIVMRVTINLDTELFQNVEKLRGDISREYLRDTLSLTYKECKSCATRITCMKCGHSWSCHWMVEQMNKSAISQIQSSADGAENDKPQKSILTNKINI